MVVEAVLLAAVVHYAHVPQLPGVLLRIPEPRVRAVAAAKRRLVCHAVRKVVALHVRARLVVGAAALLLVAPRLLLQRAAKRAAVRGRGHHLAQAELDAAVTSLRRPAPLAHTAAPLAPVAVHAVDRAVLRVAAVHLPPLPHRLPVAKRPR